MSLVSRIRAAHVKRRAHLVEMRSAADLQPVVRADGVEVRAVTDADVARVRDFRDAGVAAEFRRLFDAGHLGVYAWHGGEVAGHAWAIFCTRGRCRFWGGVDFVRGEALLAWGHVRAEMRGKRVWQSVVHELTRLAFLRGATRVVADLPLEHPELLRSMRGMGFRYLGELEYESVANVMLRRRLHPPA